jgi:hypothetical protein
MKNSRLAVLAVAGLMLLVSFAGGATAAAMITGADIKDGSVTTADIKDGSLKSQDLSAAARTALAGADGLSGYENDQIVQTIHTGQDASFNVQCPDGKTAIAATGGWLVPSVDSPSVVARTDDTVFGITGHNGDSGDNYLALYVTCAFVTTDGR